MADTIEELYYDFRSKFEEPPEYAINFYSKNAALLNKITSFKNIDTLKMYIQMSNKYVTAVYKKQHYNEAIDEIDRIKIIIDNEILRLNASEIKDNWYYDLLFVKGMASYNLHDYKTSTPVFKSLVSIDPKNDWYKNWLNYSKYKQKEKYIYISYILSVILLIIDIIVGKTVPYLIKQSISVSGMLFVLGGIIYDYYLRRSFRRKSV